MERYGKEETIVMFLLLQERGRAKEKRKDSISDAWSSRSIECAKSWNIHSGCFWFNYCFTYNIGASNFHFDQLLYVERLDISNSAFTLLGYKEEGNELKLPLEENNLTHWYICWRIGFCCRYYIYSKFPFHSEISETFINI